MRSSIILRVIGALLVKRINKVRTASKYASSNFSSGVRILRQIVAACIIRLLYSENTSVTGVSTGSQSTWMMLPFSSYIVRSLGQPGTVLSGISSASSPSRMSLLLCRFVHVANVE